jgi:predicted Rossmann fold nucleotide-binding protein DprA/Smf involved in DNA uptake
VRVAIVGSRNFNDADQVLDIMTGFPADTTIVSGGAEGADTIAAACAERCGLKVEVHIPDWTRYGNKAGFIRNREIVRDVDRVIAFFGPKGVTPGTMHTIRCALEQQTPVAILFQRPRSPIAHD